MHVNKRELADTIGFSERQITSWQKDEALPVLEVGKRGQSHTYDTIAVIQWLINREISQRIGDRREGDEREQFDKDEQLGRLRFHEANLASMDEDVRKGTLAEVEEISRIFRERAQRGYKELVRHADQIGELHLENASPKAAKASYLETCERVMTHWLDNEQTRTSSTPESSVGGGETAPEIHA